MSNFLYDQLPLPPTKGDVRPQRSVVTELAGAEINTITKAIADLRDHALTGNWIDLRKHGYKGNDVNDDTSAVLAAVAYAKANGRKAIMVPEGTSMRLSSQVSFDDVYGLTFFSPGRGTKVKWYGPSGVSMFRVRNSQHVTLENLLMQGNANPANRPSSFVESLSDTSYGRSYVPTALTLREVILGTGTANEATYGVRYTTNGTNSDTNNSEGLFDNVLIQGVTEYGYAFCHSQSKAHEIRHGGVVGAKGAVSTNQSSGQGGSFSWCEAAASACSVACFDLGAPNDPILIYRLTSEGCKRLLQTGAPGAPGFTVTLLGCRFATDGLHTDKRAIVYTLTGPLNVLGCIFDAGGSPARIATNFNQPAGGSVSVEGNQWNSPDSNAQSPIEVLGVAGNVRVEGNVFSDHDGICIPDTHAGTVTVSNSATTGSVTFNVPEFDTNYRITVTPVTVTGSVASGSWRVKSVSKSMSGFTFTLEVAPGTSTFITFDWSITRG